MNRIWFMINVLFIFSMFRCLLRESLLFSLPGPAPAFWFIFCEAQRTRKWRENQIKDFLRALSILFVFHTALALCLDRQSWGEEEGGSFFSWYHKIRTKASVTVFKHVMHQHHTYAPHRRSAFLAHSLLSPSQHILTQICPEKRKKKRQQLKWMILCWNHR